MAEWIVRQWTEVGACWLQCPNCLAVSRFDHNTLLRLYAPPPTRDTPQPKPHAKCPGCDFAPYLPLEFKHVTEIDVILEEREGGTIWAPVSHATTRVLAETLETPKKVTQWLNQKPN